MAPITSSPDPPDQNYDARRARRNFARSKDYWEFAERIHEAAKRGDGAAQYYLSVALNSCEFLYGFYFIEQRPGAPARIRTLDEAQQLTATRQGSATRRTMCVTSRCRCQRIMSTKPSPFGNAAEWMDAALASGYPLAQANAALQQGAAGAERIGIPRTSRAVHSEARALAFDALRSKDPEVVCGAGIHRRLSHGSKSRVKFISSNGPG